MNGLYPKILSFTTESQDAFLHLWFWLMAKFHCYSGIGTDRGDGIEL